MAADAIRSRYQEYTDFVDALNRNRKITDGLFGMGDAPGKDPGHTEFYEAVPLLVADLAASGSREDILDGVVFMLRASHDAEETCHDASWMMLAAQQHTLPLIGLLSPADAKSMLELFTGLYPRRLWFPVQKQVARALKKRAAARA